MIATSTILATAAVLSVAATAAGTAMSAVAAKQQGEAQKKMAEYNNSVAMQRANSAKRQAEENARRMRDQHRRLEGAQIAAAAKSGIQISGSVNDVMYDSSINSELEYLTEMYRGTATASSLYSEGQAMLAEGENALTMSRAVQAGTILTGTSQTISTGVQGAGMVREWNAQPKAPKVNQPKVS